MTERHARILGRLAEIGMALVEDLAAAALAAEAPQDKAALAGACHKLTRSVRQSLALEARLTRDAEHARHEAEHRVEAKAAQAPARRRAEAKARLDRLIWTEAETDPIAAFWAEGAARLLAESEFTAPDQPIETLVEQIASTLRAAEPRGGKPGKPETVIFEWKIVDPKEDDPPPQGEVAAKPTDGVEARQPRPSTPSVSCADSSPGGEHQGAEDPPPPPRRRWPHGLPGEFGPNGETGEDRITGCI